MSMSERNHAVLIVEDDVSSQNYYQHILRELYDVHVVSTVAEAKKVLKEGVFSVAIIDISLPGGEDGLDLIRHIIKTYPEKPAPIVITAHAFKHDRKAALKAGAVEYFTKPLLSGIILEVVQKYADRHNSTGT